ncbi:MAG TPA: pirin family protein [Nocardioidaceae bacterium]|nr:pirin family protein [Nocardioidaceae bacterium]
MSNVDTRPTETPCHSADVRGPVVERYESRVVPLGGIRGIEVHRLLPQRVLPTVGAWCFLDKFGPQHDDMRVLPHPHIGLQTVTWPLAGRIRHRDSLGNDVEIEPGQLNLMTSGGGISHSEFSLGDRPLLDGLQLWVALPAADATVEPAFERHVELPRHEAAGLRATVLMGELGGVESPATTYSPLLGAELSLTGGATATLPLRSDFEHGLLLLDGAVTTLDEDLGTETLVYLGSGRDQLELSAATDSRLLLLGGAPFTDELVMWWNFVGRSHEEIAAARADWERMDGQRYGIVPGHDGERVPAPELPSVRLAPRRRR